MATRRHQFARRSGRESERRSGTRRALGSGSVGGGERSMRIHLARRAGTNASNGVARIMKYVPL
eukprot:5245929-Prymnesium_polylepis.1